MGNVLAVAFDTPPKEIPKEIPNEIPQNTLDDLVLLDANKFISLVSGIYRDINDKDIVMDVALLCSKFYDRPTLECINKFPCNAIDSNEHIMETIHVPRDHSLECTSNMLRLTILKDLNLGYNSDIVCNGDIILNVGGDVILDYHAQILCEGNLYIRCNNFSISPDSSIATYNLKQMQSNSYINAVWQYLYESENKSALCGNIYINALQDIRIGHCVAVRSGDIKMICGGYFQCKSEVVLSAMRNNLLVQAQKIELPQQQEIHFEARNDKYILSET